MHACHIGVLASRRYLAAGVTIYTSKGTLAVEFSRFSDHPFFSPALFLSPRFRTKRTEKKKKIGMG